MRTIHFGRISRGGKRPPSAENLGYDVRIAKPTAAAIAVEIGGNDGLDRVRRDAEILEAVGTGRDDVVALQRAHLVAGQRRGLRPLPQSGLAGRPRPPHPPPQPPSPPPRGGEHPPVP